MFSTIAFMEGVCTQNVVPDYSGKLWSWGSNIYGEGGFGDGISRSLPTQIGSLTTWSYKDNNTLEEGKLVKGYTTKASIRKDGTLWIWGSNSNGQLGLNIFTTLQRSSPTQVGSDTTWDKISLGTSFSLAIKDSGTLWSWGDNASGQLGLNLPASSDRSSPVQVGSLTNWKTIRCGDATALAIKTNGTLWAWGDGQLGQLANNDNALGANRSSPTQIGTLTIWKEITVGDGSCAAIQTNGTLWVWGYNLYGELGLNDKVHRSSPVQLGSLTTWSKVSGGDFNFIALKTDGTIWGWGQNAYGTLGLGDTISRSSPVQIGNLTTWSQIYMDALDDNSNGYAIKTNGTLWGWGRNNEYEVGQGDIIARSSPVQIGSLTTWKYIVGDLGVTS